MDESPLGIPEEIWAKIGPICTRNLESGRAAKVIRRWTEGVDNISPTGEVFEELFDRYCRHVMTVFLRESDYVEGLYRKDRAAWQRLWDHLHSTGHRMLSRHGPADSETVEDFVQQTCETVFLSLFPYDVSFDAWVNTILNNHILQRYTRSRELLDRIPFVHSIDGNDDGTDQRGSPRLDEMLQELGVNAYERLDDQMLILDAIHRLGNENRQAVILYTYFLGWSDEEIAEKLQKSKGAIHILRHRAIKQLRILIQP